ncbi:hypothetical protein LTS03_000351 [Exophiala xenobiotica]|nr:hypothetical protein LTR41_005507 [Exophiala xenobiotica]KAK5375770.1 hypothetical protein LTR11_005322 [Exophiala xenobiotica]KAK5390980.1 hypothetical protein LTS03_000351 [Exophiala xenobiotica]
MARSLREVPITSPGYGGFLSQKWVVSGGGNGGGRRDAYVSLNIWPGCYGPVRPKKQYLQEFFDPRRKLLQGLRASRSRNLQKALISSSVTTMDAHAHLLSLGWAGPGHSLDSRPYTQKGHRGLAYDPAKVGNTGTGLVKPLSISQRKGRLGVGKKAHEPQAGNEWWLKGFESALGNIGKSESERSSGTSTPIPNLNHNGGKHSGLYSFFIKGQQMQGTIGDADADNEDSMRTSTKRRKGDEDTVEDAVSKKKKTGSATVEFEQVGAYIALRDEDKDKKRRKRTERPSPVEEFKQVGEYLEARSDTKKRKRNKSELQPESGVSTPATAADDEAQQPEKAETKEERRERRRLRKEEKERQKQLAAQVDGHQSESAESEDAATKAARRAERKRRKADKAAKAAQS